MSRRVPPKGADPEVWASIIRPARQHVPSADFTFTRPTGPQYDTWDAAMADFRVDHLVSNAYDAQRAWGKDRIRQLAEIIERLAASPGAPTVGELKARATLIGPSRRTGRREVVRPAWWPDQSFAAGWHYCDPAKGPKQDQDQALRWAFWAACAHNDSALRERFNDFLARAILELAFVACERPRLAKGRLAPESPVSAHSPSAPPEDGELPPWAVDALAVARDNSASWDDRIKAFNRVEKWRRKSSDKAYYGSLAGEFNTRKEKWRLPISNKVHAFRKPLRRGKQRNTKGAMKIERSDGTAWTDLGNDVDSVRAFLDEACRTNGWDLDALIQANAPKRGPASAEKQLARERLGELASRARDQGATLEALASVFELKAKARVRDLIAAASDA